jgi:oxygen-independent coproporphyrinogen-3 oxidase
MKNKVLKDKVSLYLHIPFCIKRCSYCDFTTFTNNTHETISNYVNQLCKEIKSYKEDKLTIKTIFFGGGTPSVLKIEAMEQIFQSINDTFDLSECEETTIEINPVNLNRSNFKNYKSLGINRLSMGVQTFNDELLKNINRDHSVENIYLTYQEARKAGFDNFNLDLMFGLPYQTTDDLDNTLNKAIELNPEHISLYCLDLHENTPMYDEYEAGKIKLQEDSVNLKMFENAKEYLDKNGFIHYEISNWSKPNRQAKHNLVYWRNEPYIGIGVSSASYYKKIRYTNTKDLKEYINQDSFAIIKAEQSFKEDLEETVFMKLRLLEEGLSIKEINQRFNVDFEKYYQDELKFLLSNNLLIKNDDNLKLSPEAIFVSNEVFEKFIK